MLSVRVEQGDCREVLPKLGVMVDAVVTDPPYHLIQVSRNGSPRQNDPAMPFGRAESRGGFMGQQWDGGDIAFRPETWAAVASVMRPGAFLVAFGGTRTYHRLVSAIEEAGFVIQDQIAWIFGCLDEQTQVATPSGVMPHHKVNVGDPVLCYDPATGEYSYQPVLEVVEYPYDDTAYRLIGDFGEQVVSRNHRCIVERGGSEAFQLAETLERSARVPVLENLPELQSALSGAHDRAGQPQQDLRTKVCGGDNLPREDRRNSEDAHRVRSLRQSDEGTAALEAPETGVGLLQSIMPGEGTCCAFESVRSQREGQIATGQGAGRLPQSRMEGRAYLSQSQGGLREPADPLCALSAAISEHGTPRRLPDGTSPSCGDRDWPTAQPDRDGPSSQSQGVRQSAFKSDAVRDERRSQGIRGWRGHKTAVVRVVPFHYRGVVWCLRVPTGAFVAVRNGVAFPTGNSGFPKRRDMLKPAFEPICLAYKPGGKRTLQVDECRIVTEDNLNGGTYAQTAIPRGEQRTLSGGELRNGIGNYSQPPGRWPANVCHDGSEEVIEAFPESVDGVAGKRSGVSHIFPDRGAYDTEWGGYGGSGSAARFFYSSKANAQDRWGSRHPTVKPVELMKWLVPLVTPQFRGDTAQPGIVLDPFAGSGTTGVAALATGRDCILIEREEQYLNDIRQRLAFYEGGGAHSVQAKNRSRQSEAGPLFAETR